MKSQELVDASRFGYRRKNGMDHDHAPLAAELSLESPVRSHAPRLAAPLAMERVLDFPRPSEMRLRALLDLTAAEARLAQLLASGDTLEEVARKIGIKLTTARSQLAVIFQKTGIRRQTKLVAILSRIAHLE